MRSPRRDPRRSLAGLRCIRIRWPNGACSPCCPALSSFLLRLSVSRRPSLPQSIIMLPLRLPSCLAFILSLSLLPLAAHGCAYPRSSSYGHLSHFAPSDFIVTYPTQGVEVGNGQAFPITWSKGLLDGIDIFDLEFARMSTDGLILAARDGASLKWPPQSSLSLTFFPSSPVPFLTD